MPRKPSDKPKPITFTEFLEEERKRVTAFEEWWKKKQAENPDQFPEKMWPGDWHEQLHLFDPEADPTDQNPTHE